MKRLLLLTVLFLAATGCTRSLTQRMDQTNQQLADTNAKLVEIGRKLDESNEKLGTVEKATRLLVPGLSKKEKGE